MKDSARQNILLLTGFLLFVLPLLYAQPSYDTIVYVPSIYEKDIIRKIAFVYIDHRSPAVTDTTLKMGSFNSDIKRENIAIVSKDYPARKIHQFLVDHRRGLPPDEFDELGDAILEYDIKKMLRNEALILLLQTNGMRSSLNAAQDVLLNTPDLFVVRTIEIVEGSLAGVMWSNCRCDHFLRRYGRRITLRDLIAPEKWSALEDTIKKHLAFHPIYLKNSPPPTTSSDYREVIDKLFVRIPFYVPEEFFLNCQFLELFYLIPGTSSSDNYWIQIKIPLSSIIPLSRMPNFLRTLHNTPPQYCKQRFKTADCWDFNALR